MKAYGDYPSKSLEWWEDQEEIIYDDEIDDFEWDLIEEQRPEEVD
jgi:hypothetical protein